MTKKGQKQKASKEPVAKDLITSASPVEADDEEVNSGFGSYLRSSTGRNFNLHSLRHKRVFIGCFDCFAGQETLRLFVVVNSLVMFLTIAWPQMKSAFEVIQEFITERFGSVDLF